MRMPLAVVPALLLLFLPLLGAVQPAQADVVYTEVLKGPASSRGASGQTLSQVYLNGKAMRREGQSGHDHVASDLHLGSHGQR